MSDIMVLIPVFNETLDISTIKSRQNTEDNLTQTLIKNMSPEIHKTFLSDITYFKIDDTKFIYDDNTKINCPVYFFFDKQSSLGVLQVYIKDTNINCSTVAHNIDNNDIILEEDTGIVNAEEYAKLLGLKKCGDLRCIYGMSEDTPINIIKDVASGGTSLRMKMTDKEYDKINIEKVDIFADWPLYVGRKSAIQVNKHHSFLENSNEWVIYQVSIAMMQFTAVYKANKNIEKELMYKHSIDENHSLKILEEFGICNNLYSCNMYSHTRSKQVAERLRDIFDTDERFALYKDNKELLFDIAGLRSSITTKKSEQWMFVIVMIVNVSSVLDLFADWLSPGTTKNSIIGIGCGITLIWVLYMFYKLRKK